MLYIAKNFFLRLILWFYEALNIGDIQLNWKNTQNFTIICPIIQDDHVKMDITKEQPKISNIDYEIL